MVLRRLLTTTTSTEVTVQGYFTAFRPDQIIGSVMMGDGTVAILNDEIEAADWPAPPRARDVMVIDGRNWIILGSAPVFDGSFCIGYTLHCRGS